jgi:YidC/Oxa1 family membrane protein insertase
MFTTFFYQPILNLVVYLYNILPGDNLMLVIFVLTILIKLALLPLSKKSIKSQKALQDLQPKIEEIKKKYKDNKEEMSRAMLEIYKTNKVNPFSSCLPLLIQLPFLIAVFKVFREGFQNGALDLVYPFIARPESVNQFAFGLDLSKPIIVFAVLAGAAQFWQTKMLMSKRPPVKAPGAKDEDMMAMMNKQMLYFMPVMTVVFGFSLPGGLTFYWLLTTLLTAVQQLWVLKGKKDAAPAVIEGEVVKKPQ